MSFPSLLLADFPDATGSLVARRSAIRYSFPPPDSQCFYPLPFLVRGVTQCPRIHIRITGPMATPQFPKFMFSPMHIGLEVLALILAPRVPLSSDMYRGMEFYDRFEFERALREQAWRHSFGYRDDGLVAADKTKLSLAHLPYEIQVMIFDAASSFQIIFVLMEDRKMSVTQPLQAGLSSSCRMGRRIYLRNKVPLMNRYWVNPENDMFYLRDLTTPGRDVVSTFSMRGVFWVWSFFRARGMSPRAVSPLPCLPSMSRHDEMLTRASIGSLATCSVATTGA